MPESERIAAEIGDHDLYERMDESNRKLAEECYDPDIEKESWEETRDKFVAE